MQGCRNLTLRVRCCAVGAGTSILAWARSYSAGMVRLVACYFLRHRKQEFSVTLACLCQ
jgi:hypothetical protein